MAAGRVPLLAHANSFLAIFVATRTIANAISTRLIVGFRLPAKAICFDAKVRRLCAAVRALVELPVLVGL